MIDFSKIKKLTVDGVDLKSLAINGILVWKSGYKNWVKYSTEADGVTIYNGGLGYKDRYRVRSGGSEVATDYATCTGFIPLKNGDTLRIYPLFTGLNSVNAINFCNEAFVNLGQVNDNGSVYGICEGKFSLYKTTLVDGVSVLTLTGEHDAAIRYVRITHSIKSDSPITTGADMIITVNEEIE